MKEHYPTTPSDTTPPTSPAPMPQSAPSAAAAYTTAPQPAALELYQQPPQQGHPHPGFAGQGYAQYGAQAPQVIMVTPPKSMAASVLLTFFFGPLGLFYASVTGGLILTIIAVINYGGAALFSLLTFGYGAVIAWPIAALLGFGLWIWAIIWAIIATNEHNHTAAATYTAHV